MKNEQKYKTAKERVAAFDRWRRTIKCEGCSQMCDTCEAGPLADECGFKWLALEAVGEEKVTDCNHLGNAAKIREACANIAEYARAATCHTENSHLLGYLYQIEEWAEAALSTPPRNCDIGTAEEQQARFDRFCDKYENCTECPVWRGGELNSRCSMYWAQLPYEKGETK